jgi:hypothetical protein
LLLRRELLEEINKGLFQETDFVAEEKEKGDAFVCLAFERNALNDLKHGKLIRTVLKPLKGNEGKNLYGLSKPTFYFVKSRKASFEEKGLFYTALRNAIKREEKPRRNKPKRKR